MKKVKLYIASLAMVFVPFVSAAEVPADFSMTGTWSAEYESQKIILDLKDDQKGFLTVAGQEPIKILKWDTEIEKNKVNIGIYFYSKDKPRFAKRTLRMYNAGRGFKLKTLYQSNDHLKVYNALSIVDGKIEHNDGRMDLKR